MPPVCALQLSVLGVLIITASSMEVYTEKKLEAVNGTDVRLKCTFSSEAPVGEALAVSWHFRPLSGGPDEFVFYYHNQPFPPNKGHFLGRAVWDGNTKRSDVSILLRNLKTADNGTYLCQVNNPPDVNGEVGEIQLSVVTKVKFSEIYVLALVIGVGSVLIILLVLAVVLIRYCRMQRIHRSTAVSMLECTERLNEKPRGTRDPPA